MLTVGLTGNIASGKSTVASVWRERGAVVSDADELARRAVAPGSSGLARVVERWGPGVLDAEGALDRAALREIVFREPAERIALEGIVHPRVAALRAEELLRARRSGAPIFVSDVPLLFEAGLEGEFDRVVLVDAPEGLRRERLLRDRGLTPDGADRLLAAQMPAERKRAGADFVLQNSGSLAELRERATELWEQLLRVAGKGTG